MKRTHTARRQPSKKLTTKKETIRTLSSEQAANINGGCGPMCMLCNRTVDVPH